MKKAFTLIELLIVIAIIAILAAILVTSYAPSPVGRSRDVKRLADLDAMRTALELYALDNNSLYPPDVSALAAALIPNYIAALPIDPLHDEAGCDAAFAADNRFPSGVDANGDYGYRYISNGTDYVLQVCLREANHDALASDCDDTTATPACFDDSVPVYDIHS